MCWNKKNKIEGVERQKQNQEKRKYTRINMVQLIIYVHNKK